MMLAIESSARMTRDVIIRAQHPVQAVMVLGGGARIPLIARVLERTIGVPVMRAGRAGDRARPRRRCSPAPPQVQQAPVAAGAGSDGRTRDTTPAWLTAPTRGRRPLSALTNRAHSRRELNVAVLTVSSLVVVAAIGLGLGYGPEVLERGSSSDGSQAVPATTPPRPSAVSPSAAPAATTEAQPKPPRRHRAVRARSSKPPTPHQLRAPTPHRGPRPAPGGTAHSAPGGP